MMSLKAAVNLLWLSYPTAAAMDEILIGLYRSMSAAFRMR